MNLIQVLNVDIAFNCLGVGIPDRLAFIVNIIINILKFGVPILLIIFGMLDLGKSVIASKEDEIKKGQQLFIKRLIAAIIVFFVIAVVQLVVNLVADDDPNNDDSISNCIDGFVNYHKNKSNRNSNGE